MSSESFAVLTWLCFRGRCSIAEKIEEIGAEQEKTEQTIPIEIAEMLVNNFTHLTIDTEQLT